MRHELLFGLDRTILEVPDEKLIGAFGGPSQQGEIDVADSIRQALDSPLDAPPFRNALVPGDRITVVLDSGLPRSDQILVPVLECLSEAGIDLGGVQVIRTPSIDMKNVEPLEKSLPEHLASISIVTHDPSDEKSLAYLASTTSGQRIYLNRAIVEADATLVIGRTGYDPVLGFRGTASDLFPSLSNAETQQKSRLLAMDVRSSISTLRKRQICDEVGWLAGLFYALGVSLDSETLVDGLWFGRFQSVQQAAEAHARDRWKLEPPTDPAELVIAVVSRSEVPADWNVVASALETASQLAGQQGRILIISDLQEPPGPTGRWLADCDHSWDVLLRLNQSKETDSLATAQFARAIATNEIYFFSNLEAEIVESLSMICVGSAVEIKKLISKNTSCFLIEDADRVWVEDDKVTR